MKVADFVLVFCLRTSRIDISIRRAIDLLPFDINRITARKFSKYVLFDVRSMKYHRLLLYFDLNTREYIQAMFDHQVIAVDYHMIPLFHVLDSLLSRHEVFGSMVFCLFDFDFVYREYRATKFRIEILN